MRARPSLLVACVVALAAGCSRTGLVAPPDESPTDEGQDAASPPDAANDADAGAYFPDAANDADAGAYFPDAANDADAGEYFPDATALPDAARDAERDVAAEDAVTGIDVSQTAVPSSCPDAGATLIYVISSDNTLYSFYPPSGVFKSIGVIQCPVADPTTDSPFSMAVDQTGVAYVVFANLAGPEPLGAGLFRVSTANASCQPTAFVANGNARFDTFGMGFSEDPTGAGETLFVAGDPTAGATRSDLGTIDTTTFALTDVGAFNPPLPGGMGAELTGTGAGDLFGFYAIDAAGDMAIGQIDKTNASIVGQTPLPGVVEGTGWAFAFWGGDFYTFTAPNGSNSVVTRYRPADGSIVQVAEATDIIVGAGVSTCAPQQ